MYEARQNKEKVNRTIGGGNGTRQRMNKSCKTIQCYMGRNIHDTGFVCSCTSDVIYKINKKNYRHSNGSGGNDGNSKSEVLDIFIDHGLMNLKNISQQDNPPGQCAEPHSVADALKKIPKKASILCISVSDAQKIDGSVKARCKTCKQWVNDYKIKRNFLEQKW